MVVLTTVLRYIVYTVMLFSVHMNVELVRPLAIFRPWVRVIATPRASHSNDKRRSSNNATHNSLSISAHSTVYTGKIVSGYHRLRGSGSTVVTMTSKVNGKTKILTPCRSETPKNIEAKLGANDYVMDPYNLARGVVLEFLARDSIYAIARYMPSPVRLSVRLALRLSVCLSVTRVDQSKTVLDRITQSSPQSSPMILVSWRLTSPRNSEGKIGSKGAK